MANRFCATNANTSPCSTIQHIPATANSVLFVLKPRQPPNKHPLPIASLKSLSGYVQLQQLLLDRYEAKHSQFLTFNFRWAVELLQLIGVVIALQHCDFLPQFPHAIHALKVLHEPSRTYDSPGHECGPLADLYCLRSIVRCKRLRHILLICLFC